MRRSRRAHCVSGIPNRQPFEKFAAARFGLLPIEVRTGEGRLRERQQPRSEMGIFRSARLHAFECAPRTTYAMWESLLASAPLGFSDHAGDPGLQHPRFA